MKYLLLTALTATVYGQNPETSESGRTAALAAKAGQLTRATTVSPRDADGSPVLLQQVIRRPVEWTLTTAVCSSLKSELMGSGQGRTTITLMRNNDGTLNYKINDEVSGTATDKDNRHYIFFYVNNSFVDRGAGFPRPRMPYDVYGTDVFQLIPIDGGTGYTTNIAFKLHLNADGSFVDQGSALSPNAFCDPI